MARPVNISILFLIQSHKMPSSRVRVLNVLHKIRQKGYETDLIEYPKSLSEKIKLFFMVKKYDIVYLQKKTPSPLESLILKKISKKIVYDFDDSVYLKHEIYEKNKSIYSFLKYKTILRNSSHVVAGNKILYEHAHKYNNNVTIIPSVVETDGLPQKDYENSGRSFVVGWVGGNINLGQLELLGPVFKKLSDEIPLEVRVISGKPAKLPGVKVKFILWTLESQNQEISKFDVGVMPLPDSPYARGKCGYKAIQYMACGVVPVVSDVGVNKYIVVNEENGLVAENIDDFYEKLKFLYEHRTMLKEMGQKSSQRVKAYYSVDSAVNLLDELFRGL